jgi:hypothetical protein
MLTPTENVLHCNVWLLKVPNSANVCWDGQVWLSMQTMCFWNWISGTCSVVLAFACGPDCTEIPQCNFVILVRGMLCAPFCRNQRYGVVSFPFHSMVSQWCSDLFLHPQLSKGMGLNVMYSYGGWCGSLVLRPNMHRRHKDFNPHCLCNSTVSTNFG